MDLFDILEMIGGLCLFLFGMNLMGEALERAAGNSLRSLLSKLTTNRMLGFLTGMAVTAVIQSSSATTVMVVGFVNSGIMTLKQAVGVIMGSNIGTTVTAWILSLSGLEGDSFLIQIFKPSTLSPMLGVVGAVLYMFTKSEKKHNAGQILVGFTVLMNGMDMMSAAVKPLANVPEFTNILLMFTNPILGVVAGALLTAIALCIPSNRREEEAIEKALNWPKGDFTWHNNKFYTRTGCIDNSSRIVILYFSSVL